VRIAGELVSKPTSWGRSSFAEMSRGRNEGDKKACHDRFTFTLQASTTRGKLGSPAMKSLQTSQLFFFVTLVVCSPDASATFDIRTGTQIPQVSLFVFLCFISHLVQRIIIIIIIIINNDDNYIVTIGIFL